jgi:hypothetical protein
MVYDYQSLSNKRILVCADKKVKPVHLLLDDSFSDMGRLGFLTGQALKDYKEQYGIPE